MQVACMAQINYPIHKLDYSLNYSDWSARFGNKLRIFIFSCVLIDKASILDSVCDSSQDRVKRILDGSRTCDNRFLGPLE